MARLVASFTPGPDRSDFTGAAGIGFTPNKTLTFNKIGLWCNHGTPGSQQVALHTVAGPTLLASATINLTGGTYGQWYWADISPVTLTAGVQYMLRSEVTASNGYSWADAASPSAASLPDCSTWEAGYGFSITDSYHFGIGGPAIYVGLDLDYAAPSTPALGRITQASARRVTEGAVPRITEGDRPAVGTAAITLASVSLTGSGKVTVSGTAAGTLFPVALVATGTVTNIVFTGTLSATLGALTLAGTAQVPAKGTVAATLATLALSATGTVANQVFSGTLAQTLAPVALAGTGKVAIKGTLGVTLDAVQLVASSSPFAVGTLNATLASLNSTLTGKVTVQGTAAGTLLPMVLVGTGTVAYQVSTGTFTATLASLALSASGTVASQVFRGTLSATLNSLTLSASGLVVTAPRIGTLTTMLDDLGLRGHGHTFLPWTTEARRHQLWARDTPPTAAWAIEPRADGGWVRERNIYAAVGIHRLTERGDRRITEASDVRVLEPGQAWFKETSSPVNLWTKEQTNGRQ